MVGLESDAGAAVEFLVDVEADFFLLVDTGVDGVDGVAVVLVELKDRLR